MPEDRKKLLEALVAKRKAETGVPDRKKPKSSALPAAKVSGKSSGGSKPQVPWLKGKEHGKPKKKAKRVEKYESEGSDEEEEEDGLSESEEDDSVDDSDDEETVKKSSKVHSKSKAPPLKYDVKGPKRMSFEGKGKEKVAGKRDTGGGKMKGGGGSSDEGADDEDGGDISDASGDDVDPSNILPSRTRRQSSQPVRYDLDDGSDDEDDDSDA